MSNLRAYVELSKPGVTRMCVLTTAGAAVLAPGETDVARLAFACTGSAMAVAGANAFNQWWERNTDRFMGRTRQRPLPTGRLTPAQALRFAWTMSVGSLLLLAVTCNLLTAALAAFAIAAYVLVYTPAKYRTPLALVIGAVPGAVPPLLGWTAMTGEIGFVGVVLFGILMLWQMPHFIAIALFRKAEYARAGIQCVPVARGDEIAKIQAVAWALALVPLSLQLSTVGIAGSVYTMTAMLLGMAYVAWAFTGLDRNAGAKWARGFFFASLVYLPALTLALVLDAVL